MFEILAEADFRPALLALYLAFVLILGIWIRHEAFKLSMMSPAANYISLSYILSSFNDWRSKGLLEEAARNEPLQLALSQFQKKFWWGIVSCWLIFISLGCYSIWFARTHGH